MPQAANQGDQRGGPISKPASSCTECRRRKQKCSQGQPCLNCQRRFPQPICDYGPSIKRGQKRSKRKLFSDDHDLSALEGPYSHLDLADVQDAIMQVELPVRGRPDSDSSSPESLQNDEAGDESTESVSPSSPLRIDKDATDTPFFKLILYDKNDEYEPKSVLQAVRLILQRRLNVTNRIVENEWTINGAELMRAAQEMEQPSTPVGKAVDQLQYLPMAATSLNKELVRIHLQLLCRFKASVDGNPDPGNAFMKHWVPFSIQDPLLLQVVLYTSACFLKETGHAPKTLVMAYKGRVYHMLNQNIRSRATQTSDASVLAVAQMVLDEWYWGNTRDLHAHLNGLKTMIGLRGGLQNLGLHGLLSKLIIVHDISIALAHEAVPSIFGQPGLNFEDPLQVPFQMSFNSPLISGWPPFTSCAASLNLHPCTAAILDDVRWLFEVVLSLSEAPSNDELDNLSQTALTVQGRIEQMPHTVLTRTDYRLRQANKRPTKVSQKPNMDTESSSPDSQGKEASPQSPTPEVPDLVHSWVRMTASIYSRAILHRRPTSAICTEAELLQVWGATWQISVSKWRNLVGILLWVMIAIVPSCHASAPARFVKTLTVGSLMTLGVDNWHIAMDAARAGLKLQQWLRGGDGDESHIKQGAVFGGGSVVDRHGFAVKEVVSKMGLQHHHSDEEPFV